MFVQKSDFLDFAVDAIISVEKMVAVKSGQKLLLYWEKNWFGFWVDSIERNLSFFGRFLYFWWELRVFPGERRTERRQAACIRKTWRCTTGWVGHLRLTPSTWQAAPWGPLCGIASPFSEAGVCMWIAGLLGEPVRWVTRWTSPLYFRMSVVRFAGKVKFSSRKIKLPAIQSRIANHPNYTKKSYFFRVKNWPNSGHFWSIFLFSRWS